MIWGTALDLMETMFNAVLDNGELVFDEDFMMTQMFSSISKQVDPFREYLQYMFEEKWGQAINRSENEKVLAYDELRAALFYPSRADIVQTGALCGELGAIAAMAFLTEFRDTSKPTYHYLSSADGQYS
jgi:hypothetical protein